MIRLTHTSVDMRLPQRTIVVPTPLYGGSLPIAYHAASAFEQLGNNVHVLPFDSEYSLYESFGGVGAMAPRLKGRLAELLADFACETAIALHADLVWYTAQSPVTVAALQRLREAGITTALWFVEDVRRFDYWRHIVADFDCVYTIQVGDAAEALRQHGARKVVYLPMAANPALHRPLTIADADRLRYGAPVSFVGAGYPNRVALFERLPIPDLKIWGNDWPTEWNSRLQENGRRVTSEETALIYNASKINLNLHSAVNGELLMRGDFVNPRTFEIAACGAFQLVNDQGPLADLFDDSEVAVVRSLQDLVTALERFSKDEGMRSAMAERARQRVLREHTYVQRMRAALEALFPNHGTVDRSPQKAARSTALYTMRDLKDAAWGDADMQEFLSQFADNERAALDTLVSRLPNGTRSMTRAEMIVLLMKEFRQWGVDKGVIVA